MLLELAGKEDRDMHFIAFHRKHLRRFFLFPAQPVHGSNTGKLDQGELIEDPRGVHLQHSVKAAGRSHGARKGERRALI